jgi:hypothetical protein
LNLALWPGREGGTIVSRVVEHECCEACGYDGAQYDDASLLEALRALGRCWRTLLSESGPDLRVRPAPDVWSAIEYAAHSRDVTALHAFGVEQALTVDEPSFPAISDDLVDSAADTYGHADSDEVVGVLDAEATRLARLADDAGAEAWSRGLTIGDTRADVRWLLEHALHDSLHHLDDVERGLVLVRNKRGSATRTAPA